VKLLVLSGESPLPADSGARLRVLHLTRALARAASVELAVLGDPGDGRDEPFRLVGAGRARGRLASLATGIRRPYDVAKNSSRRMRRLGRRREWDTVQVTLPSLLPAALEAGRPVVLDAHNVEADILRTFAEHEPSAVRRARWRWEAAKMERWEQSAARRVRAVVATSDVDAEAFERYGARDVLVVPNGVDVAGVPFEPPAPGTTLLYIGHYGYRPNVYAARELAEEVLPRLRERIEDATLVIVGRDAGPEILALGRGEGVEVVGAVPDVRPYLRRARLTVIPVRAGSGTRLKALEAMAAGVPVVSTVFGLTGIEVRDGEEVLIAETPDMLAEAAAMIIGDDGLATRLATRARALVERKYDWQELAAPLVELHLRLAAEG
jgi:polysaccharide biosynthesis protein PslH